MASKKGLSRLLSWASPRSIIRAESRISSGRRFGSNLAFKPHRISCIREEQEICWNLKSLGDGQHWLVRVRVDGLEFQSERQLFNYYVSLLAEFVGSKEEAKKRIYLASCGWAYGFGAQIDKQTARRIQGTLISCDIWEDSCYSTRKMDTSGPRFHPRNRHHQLDSIFGYYHLSRLNIKRIWNRDHWLINMKKPDGDQREIIDYCIKMLAKVLGSEEAAQEKIYVIWFKFPFGFGAEIDEQTGNRLKSFPDVVTVLPDYAFDTKAKFLGALNIFPRACGIRFSNYDLTKNHSNDWLVGMEEYVDNSGDSIYSPLKFFRSHRAFFRVVEEPDCKNWSITMEQIGGKCTSLQRRISSCIKTLATAMGRSSYLREVKEKIYRMKCGRDFIGFGIKIDEETSNKLKGLPGITVVLEDHCYDARTDASGVRTVPQFALMNRNARLNDMFSYHHLSEYNSEWDHDHWLVHIKQPHSRPSSERKTLEFCIQLLADVLGSKEAAKRRIYIVWSNTLSGFGVEVDKETSDKLKDRSDVLVVLPDFAFDVKNESAGVLVVSSVTRFESDWRSMFYRPLHDRSLSDYSEESCESEDESPNISSYGQTHE